MSLLYWWPLKTNYKGNTGKNLAVYAGTPVSRTDGKIDNNSFYFNGSTCLYYTLTSEESAELMERNAVSVSLWCKLDTTQDGWGQMFTIGQSGTSWTNIRFGLDNSKDQSRLAFSVSDGSNSGGISYKTDISLQDAKWHHVAAIYNKSKLYLYVDGVLQGTPPTLTYKPAFPSSGCYIHVGGNISGERIKGNIQDVRVYNHALSVREIEELHNGCILHYTFEDPSLGGFSKSRGMGVLTDSSGNGHSSTINSSFALTSDCNGRGKLAASFNGSAYSTTPALPSTTQTLSAWIKVDTYPTANQVVMADYGSKLAFGFYSTSYAIITCGTSVRYVTNLKSLWKDGWNYVVVTKDDSGVFHCYVNAVECSYKDSNVWTHNGSYFSIGCRYNSGYNTNFTGKISEVKAYVTALTADQVKAEYRSQLRLLNTHSVQAYTINETAENKAAAMNDAIFKKSFKNGVSSYTQTHCSVSMTDKGLRIYRTPNKTQSADGNVMYGGMKLQFLSLGKTRTVSYTNTSTNATETYTESDFFKTGRRYRISFHVSGFTHNGANLGFTNNMGWGGGGLNPSPSDAISLTVPSNFGISNGTAVGDEMDCFYEFTINDAVYKKCTSAYSSFKLGTIYPAYRDFQLQFNYGSTGTNGTELYITNIVCEDITDSDTHKNDPDGNTGTMNTLSVRESDYSSTNIQFSDSGVLDTQKICESGTILGNSVIDGNTNTQKMYIETLNLNNTETRILEGAIKDNTTSTNIVTSAQIKAYIDSILGN